jgi:hypothetical protein
MRAARISQSTLAVTFKIFANVEQRRRECQVLWLSSWEASLLSLRVGISILATDREAHNESLRVCCRIRCSATCYRCRRRGLMRLAAPSRCRVIQEGPVAWLPDDSMRCSNCDSENPDGAKFCDGCAAPFALQCPSCGASNRASAKFCV